MCDIHATHQAGGIRCGLSNDVLDVSVPHREPTHLDPGPTAGVEPGTYFSKLSRSRPSAFRAVSPCISVFQRYSMRAIERCTAHVLVAWGLWSSRPDECMRLLRKKPTRALFPERLLSCLHTCMTRQVTLGPFPSAAHRTTYCARLSCTGNPLILTGWKCETAET